MTTNAEYEHMINSNVPDRFQQGMLRRAFEIYRDTDRYGQATFARTEIMRVLGHERSALMEQSLRDVADVNDDVYYQTFKSDRSPVFHTEVHSGNVLLTATATRNQHAFVRSSKFRIDLSQTNQPSFFDEVDESVVPAIYVALTHGKVRWDSYDEYERWGYLPGHCHLTIPDANLRGYIHKIDLFRKYPQIVAAYTPEDLTGFPYLKWLSRSRATFVA